MGRPLFSAGELRWMRSEAVDSMSETCVILDPTSAAGTSDGMGGTIPGDPETVHTTVCRVGIQATEQERAIADQMRAVDSVVVAMPYGTAVEDRYHLTIRGRTWEVVAVPPEQTFAIETRVLAREVG